MNVDLNDLKKQNQTLSIISLLISPLSHVIFVKKEHIAWSYAFSFIDDMYGM